MIKVVRYTDDKKEEWDEFVDEAKNGTFLFKRDFMEYHADRFIGFSLMAYHKNKLVTILPANIKGDTVYSHQGLTFGGLIYNYNLNTILLQKILHEINSFLKEQKIKSVIYKCIPDIYKSYLGQEDEYLLFRLKANLKTCNISSVLDLKNKYSISRNRIRNNKKAIKNNIKIEESDNYSDFWLLMEKNLFLKYSAKPVHTPSEIKHLNKIFSKNIKLYIAKVNNTIVGGTVIFLFNKVLKVQYAHASHDGKSIGCIDALYLFLIENYSEKFDYIDFGSSNIDNGNILQENLIHQKEGFGARGVVNKIYEYQL